MTKRTLLVIGALALAGPASACLNDRDTSTLADVAGKFPNAVQVITGRFPRNPPLYYEMRIQRITDELKRNPNLLPEYDDVAVACDRIGRDDEAIDWMDKKLTRMLALHTPGPASNSGDTPWYRYYANNGTFWVHRYMRSAGKRPLSDVETARNLIENAIDLYPGAHYGRERFQVYAMDWMLNERGKVTTWWDTSGAHSSDAHSMARYITAASELADVEQHQSRRARLMAPVDGISGIIVMGAGWESVDMFDTLEIAFSRLGQREMSALAYERTVELLNAGQRSAAPHSPLFSFESVPAAPRADWRYWSVESNYVRLRKEAEEWQAKRTAYMMERLKAGRHPDTDPTFWTEYKETPAPPIYNAPWFVRAWWGILNTGFFGAVAVVTIGCILLYLGIRRIAVRTGRDSAYVCLAQVLAVIFVWSVIVIAILFPMFAKARG